jgi:nitrate/nitrite transport system substrate-binding protein
MLAGQPLAATIGFGTKAHIVTPCALDLNGNAITVSNAVWEAMKPGLKLDAEGKIAHPISAEALKPVLETYKAQGKPFNMGIVFPVSTHNYYLRYWLAAGGINPGFYVPGDNAGQTGAEVLLSVTPPPQMPATLEAGTIDGYCVGEPWNQAAVFKGIGVPVIADRDVWTNHPEKVFGLTAEFAEANPNTVIALTKAIIRAGQWLDADNGANRAEAVSILSRPEYVGADAAVIANSMTGTFEFEKGDKRAVPDFNVFFKYNATYPFYSDAIWFLTQMRRWGQIGETQSDEWFETTAKSVYRPDLYEMAAKQLIEDGKLEASAVTLGGDGYKPADSGFIDGLTYDPKHPSAYIDSLKIGLKTGESNASVTAG